MTDQGSTTDVLSRLVGATLDELDERAPPNVVRALVAEALSGDAAPPGDSLAAQSNLTLQVTATVSALVGALAALITASTTLSRTPQDPAPPIVIIQAEVGKDLKRLETLLAEHGCSQPEAVAEALLKVLKREDPTPDHAE